ncbi:glycosyltransferase family 4 protein [Frigoriglobus tundricola]|nr:glycosyltransferase family 4 protein [Frigoriglobus tundricola]
MPTRNILLIAEACNPTWSSVPLVGYNFARALAERSDLNVTVCTNPRNRAALDADPLSRKAEVVYIDNEWVAAPLHRLGRLLRGGKGGGWTTAMATEWPSYIAFELQLYQRFADDLRRGRFDLIHRVTPLTPTYPSPLASRTRVPMLVGPLNGGLPWPKEYPELRRREREWLVPLRRAYRVLPYFRSTYRRLAGVIAGSHHTATEIPSWFKGRRYYMPENGIDPQRFPLAPGWREPEGPFTFVTVGRLVPYKGFDLVIEAVAGSEKLRACRLVVIGDGPERQNLTASAARANLTNVEFAGWLDQVAVGRALAAAQAFPFPSLREFGGGVVLEAMACGLVPIVVDYGGPAELVGDAGVRLPLRPRAELVADLRAAMERLAGNTDECRRLGNAAVQRVSERFTWDAKAQQVAEIYRDLLRSRGVEW